MKIVCTLSRKRDYRGFAEVLMRLTVDHNRQFRLKSGIFVDASAWPCDCRRLDALKLQLLKACTESPREMVSAKWLRDIIALHHRPLAEWVREFIVGRELSDARKRQYITLARALERFDRSSGRVLIPEIMTAETIAEFVTFLRTEHNYNPNCRIRGHNTLCSILSRLRAVMHWLAGMGMCALLPGRVYRVGSGEVYGTPYFLTAYELKALISANISDSKLARQRDIFVFQCLTGCRVSDLSRLTPSNINNGVLEYVAVKTHRENPTMVRIPLHPIASAIVDRYAGSDTLLPCIRAVDYNRAIRRVLTECGLTRMVAVLDPSTLLERHYPINEVASSHLARRTFIGNLYREARDPCIVGSMSGHKDGSIAFSRYRTIDDDMKRDLILQTFCRHPNKHTH